MTGEVVALWGQPTGEIKAVPETVAACERLLEMAKSGEVIGVVWVARVHDGCANYQIAGASGGYSQLGAMSCALDELRQIVRNE